MVSENLLGYKKNMKISQHLVLVQEVFPSSLKRLLKQEGLLLQAEVRILLPGEYAGVHEITLQYPTILQWMELAQECFQVKLPLLSQELLIIYVPT